MTINGWLQILLFFVVVLAVTVVSNVGPGTQTNGVRRIRFAESFNQHDDDFECFRAIHRPFGATLCQNLDR